MRVVAWILLLALPAAACTRGPSLPLHEDVLVKVLADAHVVEAAVQNLSGDLKDSMRQAYFEQIYTMHQVNAADFRKALELLSDNPDRMEKIYNKVEKYLMTLEEKSVPDAGQK